MPLDRMKVVAADTQRTEEAGSSSATRQTYFTGNAVRIAASELRERIRFLRGDGSFSVDGLPPGRLTLGVSNLPNGYYLKQIVHPDFNMTRMTPELIPGQDVGGVQIVVSNQYGQISGKIVYELNGRKVSLSRRVRLRTYFWGATRYSTSSSTYSQADGAFLIKRVPAGKHKLVLSVGPNYAYQAPGPITSVPPKYGRKTSGTTIEPSACWKVSRIEISSRDVASPDPLRVFTYRFFPPSAGR